MKLAAAWAVLAEGRPLVWIDDDAIPAPGDVRDELEATGRVLLIEPRPNRGLQPADMDAIEEFVQRYHEMAEVTRCWTVSRPVEPGTSCMLPGTTAGTV